MCRYFSCLYTNERKALWYEGDSHDEMIVRSGLADVSLDKRSFVRIEVPDGDFKSFTVDEQGSLPSWFKEARACEDVKKAFPKIKKARKVYDKAVAAAGTRLYKTPGYLASAK